MKKILKRLCKNVIERRHIYLKQRRMICYYVSKIIFKMYSIRSKRSMKQVLIFGVSTDEVTDLSN